MQFNGIGSRHDADMHRVTDCMHDHAHYRKQESPSRMGGASMESRAMEMMQKEQEGQLSLSAWLERMLGRGKRFLHGFWNGGAAAGEGGRADAAQVMAEGMAAQPGVTSTGKDGAIAVGQDSTSASLHTAQAAAASEAVAPPRSIEDNPYFSAITAADGKEEKLWQKVRVKFRDVTGQLAGHLPERFLNTKNRNAFQAKQEKPKEDLRKRSRFHGDKLEIDCILTDDSYLMDSYDRKGEYSKLSTKK